MFCFCFLRPLKNRNPRSTASKIVLCSALRCLQPRDPGVPRRQAPQSRAEHDFWYRCAGVPVFQGPQENKRKQRAVGAHFEWALRHSHARHTAPYHPQPTGGLCQGPCGSGGHCRGRGLPQGHHNGPEEATAGPRHTSSALPRPRPVGHQSAPWPHQTPTKHPRGPAHHPARLWWPWAASGVAKRVKTGRGEFHAPAGCDLDLQTHGTPR